VIIDAHVRIGRHRECSLDVPELLEIMDRYGIDRAMIAPSEAQIAVANRAGNEATAAAAEASAGRLIPYAVANPWYGTAAVAELERARAAGARALAVDSGLQGFDLLDGLVDPLLQFAESAGWFVYVRTGTPPGHLPLPLALLARRFPRLAFVMGRSGATDFWIDAAPALRYAPNLYADTSYAPWDTVLSEFTRDPAIGPHRVIFSTDLPYATAAGETKRIADWPIPEDAKAAVRGGTLSGLLASGSGLPAEGAAG